MYQPTPPEHHDDNLPERLEVLIERLAEKVHDMWAAQRIKEGWSYGSQRDDDSKKHPCLVPYADLPESEKEYDRLTAKQSIASIMDFGYTIAPPSEIYEAEIEACLGQLESADTPGDVHRVWQDFQVIPNPERSGNAGLLLCKLAKKALSLGELLLANDVCRHGLNYNPDNTELIHKLALSLLELGNCSQAIIVLDAYHGDPDGQLLTLQGRIFKDQFFERASGCRDRSLIEKACQFYRKAWELDPKDEFPLINLAACQLFSGNREEASEFASIILRRNAGKEAHDLDDYYSMATCAEAFLLVGDLKNAKSRYEKATQLGRGNIRDLVSTRKQALRLADAMDLEKALVASWFPDPCLVLFAGHIYSDDGSGSLTAEMLSTVGNRIRTHLEGMDACSSISSAASGSDLLFLESIRELNVTSTIFLPWPESEFLDTSVHPEWRERFDQALGYATNVQTLSQHSTPEFPLSLEYTNEVMVGSALVMGKRLGLPVKALAVWNGAPGAPGGTASFVSLCQEHGIDLQIVEVPGPKGPTGQTPQHPAALRKNFQISEGAQDIKAFLFSDVVGYSKLSEKQIPLFVDHFLRKMSILIAGSENAPIISNTWGDALYAVFNSVTQAAQFSLELRTMVQRTKWEDCGLPKDLNIRIGLHAGPVFAVHDPVIRQVSFTGFHTSWAARIEPVTMPGEVFCSEEFAALAELEDSKSFDTLYVGTFDLAKKFARKRLFKIAE